MVRAKGHTRTTRLPSLPGASDPTKDRVITASSPRRTDSPHPSWQKGSGGGHDTYPGQPTARGYGAPDSGFASSRSASKAPSRPGTPQDFLIPVTYSQDGTLDPVTWQMLAHLREDKSGQFSHNNTRLVNVNSTNDMFYAPLPTKLHHDSGSTFMHHKPSSKPLSPTPQSPSNHDGYSARPGTPRQLLQSRFRTHEFLPFEGHPGEGHNLPDFDKYSAHEAFDWDKLVSQPHPSAVHHHHRHHPTSRQSVSQRSS